MSLQIRRTVYRGKPGWLLCGQDSGGRRISVFDESRSVIEHIRDKKRRGEQITLADFEEAQG